MTNTPAVTLIYCMGGGMKTFYDLVVKADEKWGA